MKDKANLGLVVHVLSKSSEAMGHDFFSLTASCIFLFSLWLVFQKAIQHRCLGFFLTKN